MNRFFKYKIDHIIFWAATVGFYFFTRVGLLQKLGTDLFFMDVIVRNSLLAIVIYVHLYLLIPRFFRQKKMGLYIVGLLMSIAFYVLLKNASDQYLHNHVSDTKATFYFLNNAYYNFSILAFYLLFSVALELSKQWFLQREQLRQVKIEKLDAELSYLKSQINPHFLFNSLNAVYFQIDKNNAAARETLMKFSDLLRYQLYDCSAAFIEIEKEVKYLKNYVQLQKIRKDDNYKVEFNCEESISNFKISPLLLIPFVENAFKHVSSYTGKENCIRFILEKKENVFHFSSYNTREKINNKEGNNHIGIGLMNVKRRLELLYNGKHHLEVLDNEDDFIVHLKINVE